MQNSVYSQWKAFFLLLILALAVLILIIKPDEQSNIEVRNTSAPSTNNDLLAYTVWIEQERFLMLYDPAKGESKTLLSDIDFSDFSFSVYGRIAFSTMENDNREIYILDTQTMSPSTKLIQKPATDEHPLAWSPDGRYLAFQSEHESGVSQIYVWDGVQAIDITPEDVPDIQRFYNVLWSNDGRLAFTGTFDTSPGNWTNEIYIWDGHKTVNLRHNPTGEDRFPTWSDDGQLAFLSDWEGAYDIFVWDGVSFKNGLPDHETFTNIAPDLTGYFSIPAWTNTGLLSFIAFPSQEHHAQVYVWDGQIATDMSQNPELHNAGQTWHDNGYWAFVTFFSPQQLLYIRDRENQPLLTVGRQYMPAWSSEGYLAFCQPQFNDWVLALWDGQQVLKVAKVGRFGQSGKEGQMLFVPLDDYLLSREHRERGCFASVVISHLLLREHFANMYGQP